MPARIAESVTRESNIDPSTQSLPSVETLGRLPSIHFAATASQAKTSEKTSLPTGQSAPRTGLSSSSTNSVNSHHSRHLRNKSTTVISTTPTNTSIPRPSDIISAKRPSSSPSPASYSPSITSHFTQQAGASGIDPRSLPHRRQPASRSSHGIETSTGPPPALITQRSYTTDSAWKHPTSDGNRHRKHRQESKKSIDSVVNLAQSPTDEKDSPVPYKVTGRVRRKSAAAEEKMAPTASFEKRRRSPGDDQDATLRNLERTASSYPNGTAYEKRSSFAANDDGEEELKGSQEDLFLVLARSNSMADDVKEAKAERRRSRMNSLNSRQPHTPLSPTTNGRPSSSGRLFAGHTMSSSQDSASSQWGQSRHLADSESPPFALRSSLREKRYAASAHPLEQLSRAGQPAQVPNLTSTASRTRSGSNRETSPEFSGVQGRSQSFRDSSPSVSSRTYKQSNLSYATNGHYGSSPFPDSVDAKRPQIHHAEGTASTVSTTAPSTIWDDVEDLKHRIRKLELTGGTVPLTSEAAISNVFGERPPTATTTMTTISSSPKFGRVESISPSTVRGPETTEIHPLLHAALSKSRPLMESNVYRALEATATDALTLAALATPGISQSAIPSTSMDRRFRRKADSMCRSLTELCIAFTQEKSERDASNSQIQTVKANRAVSIHHSAENGQGSRYLRASSEDPDMRSSSRILNRLEARRASMQPFNPSQSRRDSPPEASTPTQETTTTTPHATIRLDRPSVLLRRKAATVDAAEERPSSRAFAEIAHFRSSPSSAERAPRVYTSQQPLPNSSQRSPSVQSSLPVRRSYFSATTTSSPATPTVQAGSRRYLDRGTTPPSSVESTRVAAEMRRERMAALDANAHAAGTQRAEKRLASRQVGADTPS